MKDQIGDNMNLYGFICMSTIVIQMQQQDQIQNKIQEHTMYVLVGNVRRVEYGGSTTYECCFIAVGPKSNWYQRQ